MAARFDVATAVTPAGQGAYDAVCDTAWSAPRGPNGGYLAAIVLRAMEAEVADAERHARSLTCHYLRPPADGPVRLETTVERAGRSVTVVSARLFQHGKVCVVALGAFARDFPSAADYAGAAPDLPAADAIAPWPAFEGAPPIAHRLLMRPALGPVPFAAADADAVTGGWLRLSEPAPVDAAALAFYADAWLPAPFFGRLTAPVGAPTIDLTVHFRAPHAAASLDPETSLLARFCSTTSAGGFFEEDGELWSPDGTLLAQSRQLALLVPAAAPAPAAA